VLDVHLGIEQGADFLPAADCGQLAPNLGLDDFLIEPGLLQRPRVEELQRRTRSLNGSPGELAIVEQIQQPRADMFGAESIGRSVEVPGELGNGMGVVADGAFGEVAQPEIFLHALALSESWTPPSVPNTLSKCHKSISCCASGLVQITKSLVENQSTRTNSRLFGQVPRSQGF